MAAEQALKINPHMGINGHQGCSLLPFSFQRVVCKRVWSHVNLLIVSINDLQYRKSPFRNTKTLLRSRSLEYKRHSKSSNKNLNKWFSVIDTTRWREKRPFSFLDLSKILYGFIVFEVAWKDVCGINYLNELQVPIHAHNTNISIL